MLRFLLTVFLCNMALAGDYRMYINDSQSRSCLPTEETYIHRFQITSQAALEDLDRLFKGETPKTRLFIAAIRHGRTTFCGQKEREVVFQRFIKELSNKESYLTERELMDLFRIYRRSETLLNLIEEDLKRPDLEKFYKDRLTKARQMILDTRK